ncbi:inner membrane-spanning protein YciB [Albidovulum sediminicola]|uniref:Inner membrane-spanning protein YciB n=1 Tax=Albidovulum sediminicola TaxID=2984331 RepID=A0ABT2Z252_9RHOB|nr:inner membrane-spanning protein YciB [Defluviimonas sp. WL0075]MCV2865191.1 septation protein IspZ [Defluviimonas sp. WL0075]
MAGRKINPWLKLALEFGPVLAFFVAFTRFKDAHVILGGTSYGGFILATALFIPLMIAATLVLWRLTGRIAAIQIVTLVLVIVFGGLSVWFNDERFFKMKPTMIYLLFAGVLGFGLLRGTSYLALVMEEVMPLEHAGWMILTRRLAAFFAALAVLNEVIWRTMSDQAWVNFKTFGLTAAVFVFFMAQGRLLQRYGIKDGEKDG